MPGNGVGSTTRWQSPSLLDPGEGGPMRGRLRLPYSAIAVSVKGRGCLAGGLENDREARRASTKSTSASSSRHLHVARRRRCPMLGNQLRRREGTSDPLCQTPPAHAAGIMASPPPAPG